MTFDLDLSPTDLNINIYRDHLLIKDYIYLPSLKLLGKSAPELSDAQGVGDKHDISPTDLNIYRDHLLIKDYQPTKFEASDYQPTKFEASGEKHS